MRVRRGAKRPTGSGSGSRSFGDEGRGTPSPRVLLIGGLDPSGRAGLIADLETVFALGGVPAAVATTLTAQGNRYRAQAVSPALLDAQLAAAGPVDAIKVGAVPNRAALRVVARWIRRLQVPTVVDPVTRTSRGQKLSSLTPADFASLPAHVVLTPNASEAAVARAPAVIKSVAPATDAVLLERTVLLKGRCSPAMPAATAAPAAALRRRSPSHSRGSRTFSAPPARPGGSSVPIYRRE